MEVSDTALRKMLGSPDLPAIIRLMRLIETQSKDTLTRFAAEYVAQHYLPITDALLPDEPRLRAAIEAVRSHLDGAPLSVVKAAVRDARAAAQSLSHAPVAQAAARAIATACAVATTPTNALGFAFYGAAAFAYHAAGTVADRAVHDDLATQELERIIAALEAVCVPEEPNPVRVDWGC